MESDKCGDIDIFTGLVYFLRQFNPKIKRDGAYVVKVKQHDERNNVEDLEGVEWSVYRMMSKEWPRYVGVPDGIVIWLPIKAMFFELF